MVQLPAQRQKGIRSQCTHGGDQKIVSLATPKQVTSIDQKQLAWGDSAPKYSPGKRKGLLFSRRKCTSPHPSAAVPAGTVGAVKSVRLSVLQYIDHHTPRWLSLSLQLLLQICGTSLNVAEHWPMIMTATLSALHKSAAYTHRAGLFVRPFSFPAHRTSTTAERTPAQQSFL